jgi:hypothetical protein
MALDHWKRAPRAPVLSILVTASELGVPTNFIPFILLLLQHPQPSSSPVIARFVAFNLLPLFDPKL